MRSCSGRFSLICHIDKSDVTDGGGLSDVTVLFGRFYFIYLLPLLGEGVPFSCKIAFLYKGIKNA